MTERRHTFDICLQAYRDCYALLPPADVGDRIKWKAVPGKAFDVPVSKKPVTRIAASKGRMRAQKLREQLTGGKSRGGDVCAEYVADFERIGRNALARWPAKQMLFVECFLHQRSRETVTSMLKAAGHTAQLLNVNTFYSWERVIKRQVAKACIEHGLYPPERYSHAVVKDSTSRIEL